MSILIILYFSAVLFGFVKQQSKLSFLYIFVVAWIIMAGNTENPDYGNYVVRYNRSIESLSLQDFGFTLLCQLFNSLNFSFEEFWSAISTFCLISTFGTIYVLSKRYSLVASLFLLTSFFGCMITLRSFLATSVLFLGIPFLIQGSKKGKAIYMLMVLLAATIHSSSIFYSVFVLIGFKRLKYYVFILVGILYILKDNIMVSYEEGLGVDKMTVYSSRISFIASLFFSSLLVVNAYLFSRITNRYREGVVAYNNAQRKQVKKVKSFVGKFRNDFTDNNLWVIANWCMLLLIPFYLDSLTYSRLFRNIVVLNIAYLANVVLKKKTSPEGYLFLILYALYWAYRLYLYRIDYIAKPFFEHNSFFN